MKAVTLTLIAIIFYMPCSALALGKSHEIYQKIYENISEYHSNIRSKIISSSFFKYKSPNYFKSIQNRFVRTIICGDIAVNVEKFNDNSIRVPIASIYKCSERNNLVLLSDLGQIMLVVNDKPVGFILRKHLWRGMSLLSEFRSGYEKNIGRWRIIRDIAFDSKGKLFIAISINPLDKIARVGLKRKCVIIRHIGFSHKNSDCVILCRDVNGQLHQPTDAEFLNYKMSESVTFVIGIAAIRDYRKLSERHKVPCAFTELQEKILKRSPINSAISANQRWVKKYVPILDCPEPWLNKLWIAQIYSLRSAITKDDLTKFVYIKNFDFQKFLGLFADARWLADRKVIAGTILYTLAKTSGSVSRKHTKIDSNNFGKFIFSAKEALKCSPEPDIEKLINRLARAKGNIKKYDVIRTNTNKHVIRNYCELINYCRKFYVNCDFDWICFLDTDIKNKRLIINVPAGVFDFVITNIIGLKVSSNDTLHISPAKYISSWPYFLIDNLPYRGHNLTIIWQSYKHPVRYRNIEKGFSLYIDGKLVKHNTKLETIEYELK